MTDSASVYELESAGLLFLGLAAVVCSGGLVASCLRLSSFVDFTLATYLVSWALVVNLCLILSPTRDLTRRSVLLASLCLAAVALTAWWRTGHPRPASPRWLLVLVRGAFRDRLVAMLAAVITVAVGYSLALALLTPVNDGDALAYHLARAAFWHQEHGVSYVENAVDSRLDGNPPNAEIGMLFTMLLARSDRYVVLPQLLAFVVLLPTVAALGVRAGFAPREAMFGALLLGSLPVVIVQASTGLNDLVVAAFLVIATYFAVRTDRKSLVLFALAVGLALGTKFTAVLALPLLVTVLIVSRARRDWPAVGAATAAGVAIGSTWYLVNLVETGHLDGGLADDFAQRAEPSVAAVAVTHLRLLLDVVDLSGTPGVFGAAYVIVGGALIAWATVDGRGVRARAGLATAGLLVAATLLMYPIFDVVQDLVFRTWAALGRPPTPPFELGWNLNVVADGALSWFGPLGVLVFGCAIASIVIWRRGAPPLILILALAPLLLIALLAMLVVWDAYRGRLVIFGVALAASTWGMLLRVRPLAVASVAVASIATVGSMLNHQTKPSGVGALLNVPNRFGVSVESVWGAPRSEVQALPRPGTPDADVLRYIDESIGERERVAVAPRTNDFVSPYFGARLARTVWLVTDGESPPPEAMWLVVSPSTRVARCPYAWQTELNHESGWRIERRLTVDACLRDQTVPQRD